MDLSKFYVTQARLMRAVGELPTRYLYPEVTVPRRLLAVIGPRGVGKTTLILQYLARQFGNPAEALYVSADHIHVAGVGLYPIAEEHHRNGGVFLGIDEIHKHPNWAQELKSIYDSFPRMRLIVSGSSSLQLTTLGHDLSRRLVKREMMGLSFREFIGFKTGQFPPPISYEQLQDDHVGVAADLAGRRNILPLFREYIRTGYYPFWLEGVDDYWSKVQNVLDKILYEDIPSAFSVRPPGVQQLKRLLYIVATSKPFQLNVSAMAAEIGMARETLYEYLEHLHNAYILKQLWLPGVARRFRRKPGKLFFDNCSLLALLANENSPGFRGALRETFAVNQLGAVMKLTLSAAVDLQDEKGTEIEIGGSSKKTSQLPDGTSGYLLVDDTEVGHGNRVPLYLAGFLY